jgi:hypothetical protein
MPSLVEVLRLPAASGPVLRDTEAEQQPQPRRMDVRARLR